MAQRLLVLVAFAGVVAISHGDGFIALVLILLVIMVLCVAKRRIDLDESGITVIPLFPLQPKRRVQWASIGAFASTRERTFTVLKAPFTQPTPHRFIQILPKDGLSLQAVYGHGWLEAPLSANQLLELLESYRTSANTPRRPGV